MRSRVYTFIGCSRRNTWPVLLPLMFLLTVSSGCRLVDTTDSKSASDTVTSEQSSTTGKGKDRPFIQQGVQWLIDHQSPDGAWRGAGFLRECEPKNTCGGAGFSTHDGALTGLTVYSILVTDAVRSEARRKSIDRGLQWLKKHLKPDGTYRFPGEEKRYFARALASLALLRGTSDRSSFSLPEGQKKNILMNLRNRIQSVSVQRAVSSLPECVVPWFLLAMEAGDGSPRALPDDVIRKFHRIVQHSFETKWVTTEAIPVIQQWMKHRYDAPPGERSRTVRKKKPSVSENPAEDLYASYFLMQLLKESDLAGDDTTTRILKRIRSTQQKDGSVKGSWNPKGKWGPEGGRVYSTAMALLILSTADR